MQLGLYGSTDKRPLVYALFKVLQNYGDVCFITKNRQYLRLTRDRESGGHYQNVMIIVTDSSYDEVWEEIGYYPDDFSHVIYDMELEIPDNLDLTIACRTMIKDDEEDDILSWISSTIEEVKFDYDNESRGRGFLSSLFKKKNKNEEDDIKMISMTQSLWKFLETVECCRIIPPVPDCGLYEVFDGKLSKLLKTRSEDIKVLLKEGEDM